MPIDIPSSPADTRRAITELAAPMGFSLMGITPAWPSQHDEYFRKWLAAGQHGEMAYLARHLAKRLDPTKMLPGAQSVICVADRYPNHAPNRQRDDQATGRIARYAWGDDYHEVIKKRLHQLADRLRQRWPSEQYRATVDTAPVLERDHAHRAGLGWIGKHTLLLHPQLGSWLLLGEIVTTLAVVPDEAGPDTTNHCGSCTRCIDACPTNCIATNGYQLDASRCIGYLTIEHRGPIHTDLQLLMDNWVAGCDICQEVCPFNQVTPRPNDDGPPIHPRYTPRFPAPSLPLLEILGWDTADRQAAFKNSALKRIKLDPLKRNALIAAGNSLSGQSNPELLQRIEQMANDPEESELVRLTARQILDRLKHHSPPPLGA